MYGKSSWEEPTIFSKAERGPHDTVATKETSEICASSDSLRLVDQHSTDFVAYDMLPVLCEARIAIYEDCDYGINVVFHPVWICHLGERTRVYQGRKRCFSDRAIGSLPLKRALL